MRKFKIVITIISFIVIIVTKSEIDFNDLSNNYISFPLIKEILYDLGVGVFSAMILIWGIDEINVKRIEKEEQNRLSVLYQKLIPVLKKYYDFYVKLYIATRKSKVNENENVLESLFNDKENFINQVRSADPFYKRGFITDSNIDIMTQVLIDSNLPKSLPWYRCWNIYNKEFTTKMRQIEQDFSFMFPADLHTKMIKLLSLTEPINRMSDIIEMKLPVKIKGLNMPDKVILPIETFIEAYKLSEVLDALENVMKYVSENSQENILKIDIKHINERNTSPILGDALVDTDV